MYEPLLKLPRDNNMVCPCQSGLLSGISNQKSRLLFWHKLQKQESYQSETQSRFTESFANIRKQLDDQQYRSYRLLPLTRNTLIENLQGTFFDSGYQFRTIRDNFLLHTRPRISGWIIQTSQELRMLSRLFSDCKSLLLKVNSKSLSL